MWYIVYDRTIFEYNPFVWCSVYLDRFRARLRGTWSASS